MLTARQKELLKSLPVDKPFLWESGLGWLERKGMIRLAQVNFPLMGPRISAYYILTPAGQAEWDKLQETEGEG